MEAYPYEEDTEDVILDYESKNHQRMFFSDKQGGRYDDK